MLDKFLGSLKLPKWFELGDNELRYILWRSKERLERGKEHPIDLARDIVKRKELGLGEDNTLYSETKKMLTPRGCKHLMMPRLYKGMHIFLVQK